jgi:hypothetical protein
MLMTNAPLVTASSKRVHPREAASASSIARSRIAA